MKLLLALILVLSSTQTFAKSKDLSCYGREYNNEHMARHPKQTVQKIQAKFETEVEYNTPFLALEITLKGDNNQYKNYRAAFIQIEGNRWGIECDGGTVTTEFNKKGNLVLINNEFVIESECDGEEVTTILAALKGGDDVFEMVPLPSEFCQDTSSN